jgi:glycosyltransferase involved in cell wall biosynthesis
MKQYLADNRVLYYKNETNLGLVGNWNKSLEYARGEYIKILCADDKLHPRMIEMAVEVMEQHRSVSIVSTFNQWFGSRHEKRKPPFKGFVKGSLAKANLIGKRNWLFAPTANMFRRTSIKDKRFNSQLHQTIDIEFYLRLLSEGDCYVVPEILSYTRVHDESISANKSKRKYSYAIEKYKYLCIVKAANPEADQNFHSIADAELKKKAFDCVTLMYKALPRLYKKEYRRLFKDLYQIGKREGVLFVPLKYYLWQKHIQKLANKSKTIDVRLKTTF